MRTAIVPGSFDPMTLGHLDLIRQAARKYDRVVVAVMQNAQKSYLFTEEERLLIAQKTVAELSNVSVVFDSGMLIDLYDRIGACAVCKGWRNETDLAYEQEMAQWNRDHNPRFYTDLLQANPRFADHSSTRVRLAIEEKGDLAELVHPSVIELCRKKKERTNT